MRIWFSNKVPAFDRCEFSHLVDDADLPSLFLFELSFRIDEDQQIELRRIEPIGVTVRTSQGSRMYCHTFEDSKELADVELWMRNQLKTRPSLAERIEETIWEHLASKAGADVECMGGV